MPSRAHNRIRFVPARGEAGAMNMADAYARVSRSLGVVITSTGTAAGNAAGSQVEALTAGSPVLHITSQIDRPLDGPRPRRDPRRAAPGRHAARDLQGLFPGVGGPHRGRPGGGGGARRADRAARTGIAGDPDRRAAREGPAPGACRHRRDCAAGAGAETARRSGRARARRPPADAVARRRRARGRQRRRSSSPRAASRW